MKQLIVLGITGSIACVRAFDLCRSLRRKGFEVQVILSKAAAGMITEQAMEFASGSPVITEITGKIEHVKFFGKNGKAKLLLIAPSTANTISKIAMGIDDTPVTTFATVAIGSKKPVLLAPAMHKPMYKHPIVLENLEKLEVHGVKIVSPLEEEGKAKMQSIDEIVFEIEKALMEQKLKGKKILVAYGAFQEKIDDVRVITNNSSGKMGCTIAAELMKQNADVKVFGNGARESYFDFTEIKEADVLEHATLKELEKNYDYFICPAALPDFYSKAKKGKIKSGKIIALELIPKEKLIEKVVKKFPKLKVIAFKAEHGKNKKELEALAKAMAKSKKLFGVIATNLSKNPVGKDESEMFICFAKKQKWTKGSKKEIAEEITKNLK